MKFTKQQRNQIDKKRKLKTLAFVIGAGITLTGCSFSFHNHTVEQPDVITKFSQEIEVVTENTNWDEVIEGNQETIEQLTDQITETANQSQLGEFQKAALVRVVDGDTIVVNIDGQEAKVRLIGVNTPESVASEEYLNRTGKENTVEGKEASEYTKELLANVHEVYLQKDVSETDPYNRLLRYVWLEVPNDETNLTEIATKMLNGILVKEHIAEVATYEPDTRHANDFQELYDADYDTYE